MTQSLALCLASALVLLPLTPNAFAQNTVPGSDPLRPIRPPVTPSPVTPTPIVPAPAPVAPVVPVEPEVVEPVAPVEPVEPEIVETDPEPAIETPVVDRGRKGGTRSRRRRAAGPSTSFYGSLAATYDHNAQLNAQRAATRAADEGIAQAKSGFRPTITSNISAQYSRTIQRARSPQTGGRVTTLIESAPVNFTVQINQALFRGFQTVNTIYQAEALVRSSRAQLKNVEISVLLSTAQAYSDVFFFQQLVSIRQSNIRFLREQVRSAQARLDVGEGTRTDVAQSRAQLALAQSQVAVARSQLATARAQYRQFAVQPIGRAGRPPVPSRLIPSSLAAAVSIGLRTNPAIRANEHLVDSQSFVVKVAEGRLLPTLDANISARESYDLGPADSRTTNVQGTLQLTIPIYQGGAVSAQIREAKETLGQRRIELDQTRDQVRLQIASAWANLQAARSNVVSSRQQVSAARLALQGVVEERNVGQRTQLDVLQTQSTLLTAQEQAALARRDRISASYAVIAAVGRLTARKLGLRVTYYDPYDHYAKTVDRWYGFRTVDGR